MLCPIVADSSAVYFITLIAYVDAPTEIQKRVKSLYDIKGTVFLQDTATEKSMVVHIQRGLSLA